MGLRAIFKIGLFLAIFAMVWMAIFGLEKALAYYDDNENFQGNLFVAGGLDFYLFSLQDFTPEVTPTQSATRTINLLNIGNPFRYKIETIEPSGDLCNYIVLEANLDGGEPECTGNLINFQCQELLFPEFNGPDPQEWYFEATLTSDAPEEAACSFKFLFSGWQVSLEGGGFHDEEEIENTIISGSWGPVSPKIVINKVYYDVDFEHGSEGSNEWIELYNPNDVPINVSGWIIEDNTSQSIIPISASIPSYGFALITGDSSTWQYWESIPGSTVKIILPGGKIGNGLSDDGDRVILRDSLGNIIDQMSYEGDTNVFDPAPPLDSGGNPYDLPEGHILGRYPTGYDTDSASDWRDFGLPNVTVLAPGGGEIWWVGHTYTLQWTATNPNNGDNDLSIDIWYSRDSGATWANIVMGTENDGAYTWRFPLCIYENGHCYYVPSEHAQIKVVATDYTKNFMVQDWDISNEFCPPIDYDSLTPEEIEFLIELGMMELPLDTEGTTTQEEYDEKALGEEVEETPIPETVVDTESANENENTEETVNEEGPLAEEEPLAEEGPITEEEPAAEETSAAEEEPAVEEEPAAEEEPVAEEEISTNEGTPTLQEEQPIVEETAENEETVEETPTVEEPIIEENSVSENEGSIIIEEEPINEEELIEEEAPVAGAEIIAEENITIEETPIEETPIEETLPVQQEANISESKL